MKSKKIIFRYGNNTYETNKTNTKLNSRYFIYFCKNYKTAALLILAVLLIFFEKESSKMVECYKSYFLTQNEN